MSDLDRCYSRLLEMGLILIRQALHLGDYKWLHAELDLIHNIPSLLGEENSSRHTYFWVKERGLYIDWISLHGTEEQSSHMRTYYEPIWEEMSSGRSGFT